MMQDRIGQQLGNYRLVRLLGGGGFAHVYLVLAQKMESFMLSVFHSKSA